MAISEHQARWKAALSLHQAGRIAEAGDAYRAILKNNPNDALALQHLGALEASHGRLALAAHEKAIALEPDLDSAWLGRGKVLHQLGRLDDALEAYSKALALTPDLAAAWLGRANVYYQSRRYDAALHEYDKAFALDPAADALQGSA
jgi:protein O-GlcNAc transferase